jgi:hypothetical protein
MSLKKQKAPGPSLSRVLKKKRNNDPGVRHVGGRIYDSENGTTCHQCRQKTLEVKAPCKSGTCRLYWCPRCLSNRYDEAVDTVRLLPKWSCPKCRKICNCSSCRKKQGLQATGILAKIAKSAGFGSVSQLLEKNPRMSVLSSAPKKPAASRDNESKRRKTSKTTTAGKLTGSKSNDARRSKIGTSRNVEVARGLKKKKRAAAHGGIDDAELKNRRVEMPRPVDSKLFVGEDHLDIPETIDRAKLVCILEFFHTFGSAVGMNGIQIDELAKSLVRKKVVHMKSSEKSSLAVAMSNLKTIICDWFGGDQVDPEGLSWDTWLVDRHPPLTTDSDNLFEECRTSGAEAGAEPSDRGKDSETNLLGRRVEVFWEGDGDWFRGVVRSTDAKGNVFVVYDDGDELWENFNSRKKRWKNLDQRKGQSFWSLSTTQRLDVIYAVAHEALQCGPIVHIIEESIENSSNTLNRQSRHKEETERVKRLISEEKERHKQRFIAELISSQQISNISTEKQQEIVHNARQEAQLAISEENKARLRWLKASQFLRSQPPARTAAIGQDRLGASYFSLNCAKVISGSSEGILSMSEDSLLCYSGADRRQLVEALDVSGEHEGALRMGLDYILDETK